MCVGGLISRALTKHGVSEIPGLIAGQQAAGGPGRDGEITGRWRRHRARGVTVPRASPSLGCPKSPRGWDLVEVSPL